MLLDRRPKAYRRISVGGSSALAARRRALTKGTGQTSPHGAMAEQLDEVGEPAVAALVPGVEAGGLPLLAARPYLTRIA
ncbi:MAG: hypothetical protein IPJ98_18380 [Bryobacterales bacterium]|nr:hypothetical protein [Bryobacterales bacterium]